MPSYGGVTCKHVHSDCNTAADACTHCLQVHNVLVYSYENVVEPFLQPVLELCGALLARDAADLQRQVRIRGAPRTNCLRPTTTAFCHERTWSPAQLVPLGARHKKARGVMLTLDGTQRAQPRASHSSPLQCHKAHLAVP